MYKKRVDDKNIRQRQKSGGECSAEVSAEKAGRNRWAWLRACLENKNQTQRQCP